VFTSVYPSNGIVDKLFFDFDCNVSKFPDLDMQEVFNDFCKFYSYLVGIGEHPLPVVSGLKGYHIYVPLFPCKATKEELYHATLCILYEASMIEFDYVEENGVSRQIWNTSRALDSTTFGDVEQLCRIPNTLRAPMNKRWCTWLPSHKVDVTDMSVIETFEWAKRYHLRDDACIRTRTIKDYITRDKEFFSGYSSKLSWKVTFTPEEAFKTDRERMLYSMLKPFVPTSVIARVIHPEAEHDARFTTALAMLESGLGTDYVIGLLQLIGWNDWDLSECRYQVEQIEKNRGLRYRYKNYGAALLIGGDSVEQE
jgi:hypothetical protein